MNRCGWGRGLSHGRVLLACGLLVAAGSIALKCGPSVGPVRSAVAHPVQPGFTSGQSAIADKQINAGFAQLPLSFEPNQGQTGPQVKFLAHGGGYGLFLTSNEAVLTLQARPSRHHEPGEASVVRMQLSGGNRSASITAAGLLPGKSNYFIGNDPAKWHRNIPQFARVRYHDVYPGIDLVYYGNQGRLEYDFEVAPGADPAPLTLHFQGTEPLALDSSGALLLKTAGGDVNFEAPRVYQQVGNAHKSVAGRFVLRGKNQAGFELGAYDRSKTLVIDPVLTYSTYLGGSGAETSPSITVDTAFNVYLTGTTTSTDFPDATSITKTIPTGTNVFVAKLNSTGSALLFAAYVGGSADDSSVGVGIDAGFNVAIAGTTDSTDFPVNNNYETPTLASGTHAFVTELDSSGSVLLYSTYLGGNGNELASGLAVDVKNKIFVTGTTTSTNFPVTTGAFQVTSLATNQFFMTEIDPTSSGTQSLVYSTYFGGGNPSAGIAIGGGLAVDASSNVYITGSTNFAHTGGNQTTDFPILNAIQGCLNAPTNPAPCPASTATSPTDIFVAKLNPAAATGAQLQYSTYLGGSSEDVAAGIGVDSGGDAYITGHTTSSDWAIPAAEITTPYEAQSTYAGGIDAFVVELGSFTPGTTTTGLSSGLPYTYFTYLGGTSDDYGVAVAPEISNGARITGYTNSTDFPVTTGALQPATGGGTDAFVASIDMSGTNPPSNYISYLGGSGADRGTGIAVDLEQSTYVTGDTTSPNFPTANPLQSALNGASDAFVSKFGPTINLAMTAAASPTPSGVGNAVTFTYTITNNGDLTTGITFTDLISGSGTLTSATTTSGSCTTATGTPPTVTCSVGTLAASNATSTTASTVMATVTITLTPTSAGPLGNSATLTVLGSTFTTSATATASISDFILAVAPASLTTPAGTPVSYTATVTPTGGFPNSVTIGCSAGLPTGSTCTPSGTISNLSTGAQSLSLVVNTTARTTTTSSVRPSRRPFYVAWLPVSGLALFGLGVGGKKRWRWLTALLFGAVLTLGLFQAGCGSSSPTTTTTGTPAGTYTVSVTATSGSATRTQTIQLIVE